MTDGSGRRTRVTSSHWGASRSMSRRPHRRDAGRSRPTRTRPRSQPSSPPRCTIGVAFCVPRSGAAGSRHGRAAGAASRRSSPCPGTRRWTSRRDAPGVAAHGNEAIFGGSYGWASAGRFHHSQSQLHRFLNQLGGYTYSVQSYSTGTAQVIIPHVLGVPALQLMDEAPTIEDVLEHTRLVVSFGGISMKNTQINQGGIGDHSARGQLQRWRDTGVEVVCISPVRDDVADFLDADWWPIRPNADVALMLGLAHTLHSEDLHDKDFLGSHCVGYERFVPYLLGESDGVPKDADWAAAICDIEPERIRALARRMASEPCLLSISWSLQRTENGDQPYWMIAVLGAMLGNLGLPGQGVGYGYGCIHNFGFAGRRSLPFKVGALPQGDNPVGTFIPVARIADMLLDPGGTVPFNGQTLTYPDIRLIYWAGGNPFHHHQDLNRLRRAWAKPETIIVNEPFWTATARHADIVFPDDHGARARGFRVGHLRALRRADAPGPRAVRAVERRLRDPDRPCRTPRLCRALHRGATAGVDTRSSMTTSPGGPRGRRGSTCRPSTSLGA